MQVEPLRPEDAEELIRLSLEWNQGTPVILPATVCPNCNTTVSPGAHGAVVREKGIVQAWGLLRETAYGFCTDELWCRKTKTGRAALMEIAAWLEQTVEQIAFDRNLEFLEFGGMVRLDNPSHDAALAKYGYEIVANVRAKRIYAKNHKQEMVAV